MKIGSRETHPAADAFPLMIGEAFKTFVGDIRANGLIDSVGWLDKDGRILDARNRARAAEELGIELEWRTYDGDDIEAFVMSKNLHRRNMNESQRAIVAAKFAIRPRGRAKKDTGVRLMTLAELAEHADVGESTLKAAKQVLASGAPELVKAIEAGDLTVMRGAELAMLPRSDQLEHLARARPESGNELRRKRTQKNEQRLPPADFLLATAVRAFEKLGATIETLRPGELLVRFNDQTFELQLRPTEQTGRAA